MADKHFEEGVEVNWPVVMWMGGLSAFMLLSVVSVFAYFMLGGTI
ncbi:MAG: hypothetical protein AB7K24_24875 [Gemmataceae bacterium]